MPQQTLPAIQKKRVPALPPVPHATNQVDGFVVPDREQKFPTLPLTLPDRCPRPDAQGIAETIELYQSELGREINQQEAEQALGRVMHFLWAINLHRSSPGHASSPDQP